jgi:hypothetical protein
MSGPQPYITVNCTSLCNGSNTKLTLQAYGNATGGSQGAKIIMNGNNGSGVLLSFINDTTTTCTMTGSRCGINTACPICNLDVAGIACIHNGSPYAVSANFMQSGSLTIGGSTVVLMLVMALAGTGTPTADVSATQKPG